MREVASHVIATEGQHGHWIATESSNLSGGGGGRLAARGGAEKGSMLPIEGLRDERDNTTAASAEQDGVDWNAFGIFPFFGDDRALSGGRREAGIRVGCVAAGIRCPWPAQPVHEFGGLLVRHSFPPDVAVRCKRAVGKDGVFRDCEYRVRIRLHTGSGRNSKKAGFRVDRVQAPVGAELHPCDVIADGFHLPSGHGGDQHGQIRFAACGGERARHVFHVTLRICELEDEHVLGQPTFVARLNRSDPQCMAFLAEQRIAAVAGAV